MQFHYKQRNNIVLVILIILGCATLYSLRTIAGSLLSTVVMYTIFRPIYLQLTEGRRWNRIVAAITIIVSSFIIIIVPFIMLSFMVIQKIADFRQDPMQIKVLLRRLQDFAGSKLNQPDLVDNLMHRASAFVQELFPSILGGAADLFLGVIIMYFLLYFMFIRHEQFEEGLLHYSPFSEQNSLKFATELRNTTYSNVLGQGFIAIVQGILVTMGFLIFGINDPIFWGVISTFLAFLPFVGAPAVLVAAGIIELANGNRFTGIALIVWGLVLVANIDNVIRFMIAKRVANTHPIITVIGVVIGIPVFGIMGLVFGPLLLSYFVLTIRIYETSRLATERLERIKSAEEENTF
jgi:predicted PurR-regulated permease PerM